MKLLELFENVIIEDTGFIEGERVRHLEQDRVGVVKGYEGDETAVEFDDEPGEIYFVPNEDLELELEEGAKPIWVRKGKKITRGYRCTTGRKQGRIVSNQATCGGKLDVKKRMQLRKLMQTKGKRLRRKALKTKKRNPVSKRLQQLNKISGQ